MVAAGLTRRTPQMEHPATEPVEWRDGRVPVSPRFEDPYFSITDGLAETRHVFLDGNGLPAQARAGFVIAELGFGTGLNLAVAAHDLASAGVGGPVSFVSFEAFPIAADDMRRALAAFPDVVAEAEQIVLAWAAGAREFNVGPIKATVIIGDARDTLPAWNGRADAWFLDGFAPARNPGLWTAELMATVAKRSVPGATFSTYSAAGAVRRALADAGFSVERKPGFGHKRHMTIGRLERG